MASRWEADERRAADPDPAGKDLLVRIHLDREMAGSKKGEVEVWFNRELIPISGLARDVRFFGDIRRRIIYRGFPEKPWAALPMRDFLPSDLSPLLL